MQRFTVVLGIFSLFLFVFLGGCQDEPIAPNGNSADFVVGVEAVDEGSPDPDSTNNPNFGAIMSGDREVPPNDSRGQGVAKMKINGTKDSIFYFINVSNLSDVTAAHIHRAGYGNNGPVVATLYTAASGGGPVHGRLMEGYFTPADLVGPFAGSTDFDLFIEELHVDSLYVNVHTDQIPAGEIRGQLRSAPYGGLGVKDRQF